MNTIKQYFLDGKIKHLTCLLQNGDDNTKENALKKISKIYWDPDFISNSRQFTSMLDELLLTESFSLTFYRIHSDCIKNIAHMLLVSAFSENSKTANFTARLIANFAHMPDFMDAITDANGIACLITLLKKNDSNAKEYARAIANLEFDSSLTMYELTNANALPALIHALNTSQSALRQESIHAIANMTSNNDWTNALITTEINIESIIDCLNSDNSLTLEHTLKTLRNMATSPTQNAIVDAMIQAGATSKLQSLLEQFELNVNNTIIRQLLNILGERESQNRYQIDRYQQFSYHHPNNAVRSLISNATEAVNEIQHSINNIRQRTTQHEELIDTLTAGTDDILVRTLRRQSTSFFSCSDIPSFKSDIRIKLDSIDSQKAGFESYLEQHFPFDLYPDMYCPISKCLITDPVILGNTRHSFDRASIEEALKYRSHINPMTNLRVTDDTLRKNDDLQRTILDNIDMAAKDFLSETPLEEGFYDSAMGCIIL